MSDPTIAVTIGGGSPFDGIAGAVGAGENLAGDIIKAGDTPEMVSARRKCSLQEAKDAIIEHNAKALKTGNASSVNVDLS